MQIFHVAEQPLTQKVIVGRPKLWWNANSCARRATLNAKSDRRTPKTVAKCKFSVCSRNPLVTSPVRVLRLKKTNPHQYFNIDPLEDWYIGLLVFYIVFFQSGVDFLDWFFSTFFQYYIDFSGLIFFNIFSGIWHLGHCCLSRFFKYIPCIYQETPTNAIVFLSKSMFSWVKHDFCAKFWVKHCCCLRWCAFFKPL